jgi:hypothetical protein|nr:MAG TPA: ethylene-responsive transcription factor [Bacteriophage sp.]
MAKIQDLIGKKFWMLTVIDVKREKNKTYCLCECECGNTKWIRSDAIKSGKSTSCGCNQYVDLLNKKIGRLTVIEKTDKRAKRGRVIWKCLCDCGNIVEKSTADLKKAKSCGCLFKEQGKEKAIKMMKANLEKNIIEGVNVSAIKRDKLFKHNTSGVTGVFYDTHNKKWVAQIYFKNKCYRLGWHETKEKAIEARKEAEEKLHKEFLIEKGIID